MPNPLLTLLLPPAYTMCCTAETAPHTGPAQLPALDSPTNWSGQQLEAAQWQDAEFCKNFSGKAVMSYAILLGVGGPCYDEHTTNQFGKVGLDHQRAIKLASKLEAHSVKYALKLVTTGRAT
eukprot:1139018-Pelagomonas_calceolata.AAC.13